MENIWSVKIELTNQNICQTCVYTQQIYNILVFSKTNTCGKAIYISAYVLDASWEEIVLLKWHLTLAHLATCSRPHTYMGHLALFCLSSWLAELQWVMLYLDKWPRSDIASVWDVFGHKKWKTHLPLELVSILGHGWITLPPPSITADSLCSIFQSVFCFSFCIDLYFVY